MGKKEKRGGKLVDVVGVGNVWVEKVEVKFFKCYYVKFVQSEVRAEVEG